MPETQPLLVANVQTPSSPLILGAQSAASFATAMVVADDESYEFANKILQENKGKARDLETERRAIVDPINAGVKRINDLFRGPATFYAEAERLIKQKMVAFYDHRERERQRQERAAADAAEAERKGRENAALVAAAAAAESGDAEGAQRALEDAIAPAVPAPVAAPLPPRAAGTAVKKAWKFRVVDASKVPRDYLAIDEAKIRGVVNAMKGDTRIPGIEVYAETALAAGRA